MGSTIVHRRSENNMPGHWFGKVLPFLPEGPFNRGVVWPRLLVLEYWKVIEPLPIGDILRVDWNGSHKYIFHDGEIADRIDTMNGIAGNPGLPWSVGLRQEYNLKGIGFGNHGHFDQAKVCETTQKAILLMEPIFALAAAIGKTPPRITFILLATQLVAGVLPLVLCPNIGDPGAVGTPDPWGYIGRS